MTVDERRFPMTIVPISHLSLTELSLLGNNIRPSRRSPRYRHNLAAINRSLAPHGERVTKLHTNLRGVLSPGHQRIVH
jgi:hypothetical protein